MGNHIDNDYSLGLNGLHVDTATSPGNPYDGKITLGNTIIESEIINLGLWEIHAGTDNIVFKYNDVSVAAFDASGVEP